jgi:hypothetical protein
MTDDTTSGRRKGKAPRQGSFSNWRRQSSIVPSGSTSNAKKLERLERFSSEPNVSRSGGGGSGVGSWRRPQQDNNKIEVNVEDFGFVSKGNINSFVPR